MWSVWKDNLIYLLLVPAFCRLYLVVVVDAVVVVVEVVGLRGTNDVTGFSSEVSFFLSGFYWNSYPVVVVVVVDLVVGWDAPDTSVVVVVVVVDVICAVGYPFTDLNRMFSLVQ